MKDEIETQAIEQTPAQEAALLKAVLAQLDDLTTINQTEVAALVRAEIKILEPEMTARITTAAVEAVTDKVSEMITTSEDAQSKRFDAAVTAALRTLTTHNDSHGNAMTMTFNQSIANLESRLEPKLAMVNQAQGSMNTLTSMVESFRNQVKEADEKAQEIELLMHDSDMRMTAAHAAAAAGMDKFKTEIRDELQGYRRLMRMVKVTVENPRVIVGVLGGGVFTIMGIFWKATEAYIQFRLGGN